MAIHLRRILCACCCICVFSSVVHSLILHEPTKCVPGTFMVKDSEECFHCPLGKYQPVARNHGCLECPIGTFANILGLSECMICPQGYACETTGTSAPTKCFAKQNSYTEGATSCIHPTTNMLKLSEDSSSRFLADLTITYSCNCYSCSCGKGCVTSCCSTCYSYYNYCAAGRYYPNGYIEDGSTCTACPGGQYQPATGQSSCSACPGGYYCPSGSITYISCPGGYYCPSSSSTYTSCPAGYYCPSYSSSYKACPGGYYCPSFSSTYTSCPAGYYCPSYSSSYNTCPGGYYCPSSSSSPLACPGGTYCPIGSSSVTTCPGGYYCPTGSLSATSCAAGTYAPSSSSSCTQCGFGEYQPLAAQTECSDCAIGKHIRGTDHTICLNDTEPSPIPTNSYIPSPAPSQPPSYIPSFTPTLIPTLSLIPSSSPSLNPTRSPTLPPTFKPTPTPSLKPTPFPSVPPSPQPSKLPTPLPSSLPTLLPSLAPSILPSLLPSSLPTNVPTEYGTMSVSSSLSLSVGSEESPTESTKLSLQTEIAFSLNISTNNIFSLLIVVLSSSSQSSSQSSLKTIREFDAARSLVGSGLWVVSFLIVVGPSEVSYTDIEQLAAAVTSQLNSTIFASSLAIVLNTSVVIHELTVEPVIRTKRPSIQPTLTPTLKQIITKKTKQNNNNLWIFIAGGIILLLFLCLLAVCWYGIKTSNDRKKKKKKSIEMLNKNMKVNIHINRNAINLSRNPLGVSDAFTQSGEGLTFRGKFNKGTPIICKQLCLPSILEEYQEVNKKKKLFEKEVEKLVSMSHMNVQTCFGICQHKGYICLVSEYYVGSESLDCYYPTSAYTEKEFYRVGNELLSGLTFLHQRNIAHNNITPQNISLVGKTRQVRICGFAFLKCHVMDVPSSKYMAPELLNKLPEDEFKIDVYAVGMILYELWTRIEPFGKTESLDDILTKVYDGVRPDFLNNNPPLPRFLKALIDKCWHQSSHQRPSMEEVANQFSTGLSLPPPSMIETSAVATSSCSTPPSSSGVKSTTKLTQKKSSFNSPQHSRKKLVEEIETTHKKSIAPTSKPVDIYMSRNNGPMDTLKTNNSHHADDNDLDALLLSTDLISTKLKFNQFGIDTIDKLLNHQNRLKPDKNNNNDSDDDDGADMFLRNEIGLSKLEVMKFEQALERKLLRDKIKLVEQTVCVIENSGHSRNSPSPVTHTLPTPPPSAALALNVVGFHPLDLRKNIKDSTELPRQTVL